MKRVPEATFCSRIEAVGLQQLDDASRRLQLLCRLSKGLEVAGIGLLCRNCSSHHSKLRSTAFCIVGELEIQSSRREQAVWKHAKVHCCWKQMCRYSACRNGALPL